MKKYNPTTPGRRGMTTINYRELLSGDAPNKSLTKGGRRGSGRANSGRISVRHKGGGHKRRFREVDFRNSQIDIPGKVATIEYDPNRTGFIALINYANGAKAYVLAPQNLAVGDTIITAEKADATPGNRMPLKNIPLSTFVYNIELKENGGARIARSAGSAAEVIARDGGFVHIKMPSSEVRKVPEGAWATVGSVSNPENILVNIGKAGRNRWKGIRPTVRGSAMNPVDHPYGGGEGKQGRGMRRAKTKWGKPSGIGQKTRTPKKYSNKLIVSRRKVGKKRK
ncbi:50S ribosomal protein L2 [Candidatus Wolfebacteria bacterium]|nr:MAG: 50S ribosomal protein L2 [Candidatus Wolfebacteria bacterium]